MAVDALHDLIWQKTKDGRKNRKRPKRIPRPKRAGDNTASTGLGTATVMNVEDFVKKRADRFQAWRERKAREARAKRES